MGCRMRPLGIFAWFGYELPLTESFRRIRAAGFDQVLLWWGEYEGELPLLEQPEAARRLGLAVENAHAPFDGCNSLWLPGEAGDAYVRRLITCVEGCAAAGVPALVVHLTDEAAPPACCPLGGERIRRVVEAAEDKGVRLAFENLRHAPHLLNACPSPAAGFCYDSGHHHIACREQPFLERYGGRLTALHLHDNDGKRDLHHLPLDGSLNWDALAAELAATGYSGGISLEVQAFTGYEERMTADEYLARAYRAAEAVRNKMD